MSAKSDGSSAPGITVGPDKPFQNRFGLQLRTVEPVSERPGVWYVSCPPPVGKTIPKIAEMHEANIVKMIVATLANESITSQFRKDTAILVGDNNRRETGDYQGPQSRSRIFATVCCA